VAKWPELGMKAVYRIE